MSSLSRSAREAEFWRALEFRVAREFQGMVDRQLRHFWCDGFTPEQYHLQDTPPTITGHAYIVDGQTQQSWKFTLYLDRAYSSPTEIDWTQLLPADTVTRWLAIDQASKVIQIEPAAAQANQAPKRATRIPH
jgi:hypothetical protein